MSKVTNKALLKEAKEVQANTKKLIAAYSAVVSDLSQDIGYTRRGQRQIEKTIVILGRRLWELENVWLDTTDIVEDIEYKTAQG
jgi:hypothetical protein